MNFPKYGFYCGDDEGNVILETMESPACSIFKTIISAADISNTVVGFSSGK